VKIALIHDYLNQMGGAENVLMALSETFPEAPIFTSIVDYNAIDSYFKTKNVYLSFIQKIPNIRSHYKNYFFLYPFAFKKFNLDKYDIVISSSSAFSKGINLRNNKTLHINYCHTPMRFVWMSNKYIEKERIPIYLRIVLQPLFIWLKRWDLEKNKRINYFIANSTTVQKRIKKWYNRKSTVIFPPVDTQRFIPSNKCGNYYLIVSRLKGYKRIDLAIHACSQLGLPLKIAGTGENRHFLEKIANENIEFLGYQSDKMILQLMQQCKAFLFPGEEDFGIAPVEAQACGKPVIAYKGGGALDTVIHRKTGLIFEEQNVDSLKNALQNFEKYRFNSDVCRRNALRFKKDNFIKEFNNFLLKARQSKAPR